MPEPERRPDGLLIVANHRYVPADRLVAVADDAPEQADADALVAAGEGREGVDDARRQQHRPGVEPDPLARPALAESRPVPPLAIAVLLHAGGLVVGLRDLGSRDGHHEPRGTAGRTPQTGDLTIAQRGAVGDGLTLPQQPQVRGRHAVREAKVIPRDLGPERATGVVIDHDARAPQPAELDRSGKTRRAAADDDAVDDRRACRSVRQACGWRHVGRMPHIGVARLTLRAIARLSRPLRTEPEGAHLEHERARHRVPRQDRLGGRVVMTDTTTPAASPATVEEPPEFPIVWSDPADRERSWAQDDMHSPFCLTPLSQDYTAMIGIGFDYRYERLDLPISMRAKTFNGYLYFSWKILGPESEEEAISQQYVVSCRAHTPLAVDYWARAVPELRQLYDWIASVDVETLPGQELADAWDGAWERAQRAWAIHFYAITGPYQVMEDLADLYESVIEKPPPGEALRLIGGTIEELVAVDAGLGRLAELAATSPGLADAIRSRPAPSLEELATHHGGETFVSELRGFLAEHGHLGQGFDDLALASWGEEPEMLLAEVAKRIDHPIEPAMERAARLAHEADRLADGVRERLADQLERLAEFERLLGLARQIGSLTEGHNYWIDRKVQARLRAFAMRVGARLVRDGVIERPEDVLYLRRAEVPDLLRAAVDRRDVVAGRKAEHEHWRTIKPPPKLGKPDDAEPSGRFGGARFAKEDDSIVRGTGASPGIVSGPARVVLGPDDFERVLPGDIIIAPSSNPSWVPLFSIAGGLVTNTGGVLCHAAVVARELDLPAVVGTGDATTRIADGQMLELDGTTGFVRLL